MVYGLPHGQASSLIPTRLWSNKMEKARWLARKYINPIEVKMAQIGTPLSPSATRVLMLGSGELGKEVVIELQRLGVEVIAVDRYENAPAMQVAHRSHAVSMLDGAALRAIIENEKPDYIVPEIEAIATDTLVELEAEGYTVIPTARAAKLTMNREEFDAWPPRSWGLRHRPTVSPKPTRSISPPSKASERRAWSSPS